MLCNKIALFRIHIKLKQVVVCYGNFLLFLYTFPVNDSIDKNFSCECFIVIEARINEKRKDESFDSQHNRSSKK